MKTYIVQLESHDDVISARDKISWSKDGRVLLVWPRYEKILERRVDLLMLMRHCQRIGAQMAIVSPGGEVSYHARALGISVFRKVEQAQKSAWRRPEMEIPWGDKKPASPQSLRQMRVQSLLDDGLHSDFLMKGWPRFVLFTLAVISFLLLALSFAPEARISVKPVQKDQELSLDIWASPEIRAPNPSGRLPAYVLSVVVEGGAQANSTGRTLVSDQYAAGQAQLTNITGDRLAVPQGSVVVTRSEPVRRFITTRTAQLPPGPGTSVEVPVQAVLPGQSGNVGAHQIQAMEGLLGQQLLVSNPLALSGGSDRSSPAGSRADYRRLREKLLLDLEETALDEMSDMLEPGQRLLAGSLRVREILTEDGEPAVGYPSESLQLTMQVEFEGWYIKDLDLEAIASTILDASLPDGFQPVADSFRVELDSEAVPAGKAAAVDLGEAYLNVTMGRVVEAGWVDSQIIHTIQGRTLAEASQILQERLSLSETPTIELYPAWWGRLPFLPVRIALEKQ